MGAKNFYCNAEQTILTILTWQTVLITRERRLVGYFEHQRGLKTFISCLFCARQNIYCNLCDNFKSQRSALKKIEMSSNVWPTMLHWLFLSTLSSRKSCWVVYATGSKALEFRGTLGSIPSNGLLYFKNGPAPASFCLFSVISNKHQYNFYNKSMWKNVNPSSIWRWDSNPRPFEHKSSPITTRPWLLCYCQIQ